jgi:hypothetical protein
MMSPEQLRQEIKEGLYWSDSTEQRQQWIMELVEKEKRAAVDQALALSYQQACRGDIDTGAEDFYRPIMERLFPSPPMTTGDNPTATQ